MGASHLRAAAASSAFALFALFGLAFACGKDSSGSTPTGSPIGKNGEDLFRGLQTDLVTTCGGPSGGCHVNGTTNKAPTWLANPDPYESAIRYKGILPADHEPGDSILLTQIAHTGPALKDAPNNLYGRVADWLLAELPPPALPNSGAFSVVGGLNVVNLANAASGLTGAKITFLADDENGVLTLSSLRIFAPQNANMTVTSPFFVVLPRSGKVNADPTVNGFQGELTVPAGSNVQLYEGKMVILRWDPTGQLKIVFNAVTTTPGQGIVVGCTALDQFRSSALTAMRGTVQVVVKSDEDAGGAEAGSVIGPGSCVGCHASANQGDQVAVEAVSAMDLRDVDKDPASACAQAKNWINFEDKAQSVILLNPQGKGNPTHPIQPLSASDPIIVGLKTWVDAEQQR